jgi:hypothetical protein
MAVNRQEKEIILTMNPTEHLTRSERMQRIGELLAKGIALLLTMGAEEKRLAASQASTSAPGGLPSQVLNKTEPSSPMLLDDEKRRIVEYLMRVRKASPRYMQLCLDLAKATLFRCLKRLLEANLVVRSGKTAAIRYQLATSPAVSMR